MEFLALILPKDAVPFHCPNGGLRSKKEAAILKAMGVLAGIPDIIILWNRRAFCLELKSKDGTLQIEQRDVHARLHDTGVPVETVRTMEEIRDRLEEFGIPLRRTVRFGNEFVADEPAASLARKSPLAISDRARGPEAALSQKKVAA